MSLLDLFTQTLDDPDPAGRLSVDWNGIAFDVSANERTALEWLAAHMYVSRQAERLQGRGVRIGAVTDGKLLDGVVEELRDHEPQGTSEGYTGTLYDKYDLDTIRVLLLRTSDEENSHLIAYTIDDRFLVVSDADDYAHRNLTRIVREVLRREQLRIGGLQLHSACGELAGRGAVFIGGSGSGKTTLGIKYATREGSVVATDRSVIATGDGRTTVFGNPAIVRLGAGTSASLGRPQFSSSQRFVREQPALAEGAFVAGSHEFASRTKLDLTPVEFSVLFRQRLSDSCGLGGLVFPTYDPHAAPVLRDVSATETVELAADNVLHPDPVFPSFFTAFDPVAALDTGEARERLVAIAATVPCFRMTWSADDEVTESLLRDLRAACSEGGT